MTRTFRRRRPEYVEDSGRRPIAHKTAVRGGEGAGIMWACMWGNVGYGDYGYEGD